MKRLLLFVLLLIAGFAILQYSLGDQDFAGTAAAPEASPQTPAPQDQESMHVIGRGQDIGVVVHGGMTIPRSRDVRVGNSIHHVPIYELSFLDSAPVGDGLQQLDDVTLKLFDRGVHAATLVAKTAFVELARDLNGRPSLREDKDVELRQAVLDTLPQGRLMPLHLEIGVVRLRVRDEEIELHTPTEQEPVLLVVEGERPGRMTGRGLQARLPKDQGGQLRRIDLEILHQPVLITKDLEIRAAGRMHYVEETERGAALITIDDDVHLKVQAMPQLGAGAGSSAGEVDVRGDHLSAWIGRQKPATAADGERRERGSWRLLRLDGAPAQAIGNGVELRAARLTVVPGAAGEPYLLAAAGGQAELVQHSDGAVTTFAGRRIYNVRPGAHLGAMYRSFGFSTLALGQLQRLQIGVCDGDSTVTADAGVELHSQRGLWAFQLDADQVDGGTMLIGRGAVRVAQGEGRERLLASGDNGLSLTQRTVLVDGVATVVETLVLGDGDASSAQHYELRRGALQLAGTGACRFDRAQPAAAAADAAATVTLRLRSNRDDIHGTFDQQLGEVQGARTLDATLLANELSALQLAGPRTRAIMVRGSETLTVSAPRMTQETPLVLRLDADGEQLPTLRRSVRDGAGSSVDEVLLRGPLLRIHRVGQRLAVLTAERAGDRRPHVEGVARPTDRGRIDYSLDADHVQLQPFAVAASAIDVHGNFLPTVARGALAPSLRQPWMFADGEVDFRAEEAGNGSVAGHGQHLAVAQGSQSAMLVGDADTGTMATLVRTAADGRVAKARGPWLRLWREDGERVTAFTTFPGRPEVHLPELELHSPHAGSQALADLWATCDGELQLLPDRVEFAGPVRAHALLPDGGEDPTGMHVRGEHVHMLRDDSGRITRVVADGGVVFDYRQMHAEAKQVELDTAKSTCTVSDPEGALIMVPGYEPMTVRRAQINYVTYRLQASNASTLPAPDAGIDKRP